MGTITINGKTYSGNNINVINGKVIIDGVEQTPEGKQILIAVKGNVNTITVDSCEKIAVQGDIGNVKTMSGDVEVRGNVTGSVQTMSGDVEVGGEIHGNVSSVSGDIN